MQSKVCGKCGKRKRLDLFGRNATKRDGHASNCKACRAGYARSWYKGNKATQAVRVAKVKRAARRRARLVVREHLSSHPCVDCGERDWRTLELDHVRGQKKGNISDMVRAGRAPRTITAELRKCEVRCANCHRIRTGAIHGWAGYG